MTGASTTDAPTSLVGTAIPAPWGPVHLAAGPGGLIAVELMAFEADFRAGVERRRGAPLAWRLADEAHTDPSVAAGHLRAAVVAFAAAFDGDDRALNALAVDLSDRPAWDIAVLGAVRAIPRGETRGYGDVARAIGRPGAARAVGGAVGRNPLGFVIPCHRVIAGDGTLGGYGGGWWGDRDRLLDLKAELLRREGRTVRRTVNGSRAGR